MDADDGTFGVFVDAVDALVGLGAYVGTKAAEMRVGLIEKGLPDDVASAIVQEWALNVIRQFGKGST